MGLEVFFNLCVDSTFVLVGSDARFAQIVVYGFMISWCYGIRCFDVFSCQGALLG